MPGLGGRAVLAKPSVVAADATGYLVTRSSTGVDTVTLGFQPKALIFTLCSPSAFSTGSVTGSVAIAVGFTDGTTTRCAGLRDLDASATSNTGRSWTSDISLVDASGGFGEAVGAITLTSTGFEINWTTKTSADTLTYLAIGGADVSAKVLSYSRAAGTGAVSVTGAGFQPKGGVLLTSLLNSLGGSSQSGFLIVGIGDDDTQAGNVAYSSKENSAAADSAHVMSGTRFVSARIEDNSGTYVQADLTSWNADGYTITYNVNTPGAHLGAVLCLGGAGINATDIVDLTADTTTGAHTQTMTGLPFQPDAAFIMGVSGTASSSSGVHGRIQVGMFDSHLWQGSVLAQSEDAADPTETQKAPFGGQALSAYNSTADTDVDAYGAVTAIGATSIDVAWQAGKTADAFVWKALLIDLA